MYNRTVAAAQFEVYAVYLCATQQQQFIDDAQWIVCRSERAT